MSHTQYTISDRRSNAQHKRTIVDCDGMDRGPKGYDEHIVRDVSVRSAWQDRTHHMNQKLLMILVKL